MAVKRKKILEPYDYGDGLSIRRISELFRQWSGKSNVTVRLVHKPGYACQVDWVLSIKTDKTQSTSTSLAALWPTLLVTCLDTV